MSPSSSNFSTERGMNGKVALITGGTQGIGKETARGLARLGATVVIVARDQRRGEAAISDIKASSNNPAVELLMADLSSQADVRNLAKAFASRHEHLHVLVNNAGNHFPRRAVSVDGIEMSLALNHLASFLLTRLLLETIRLSAPARIINVVSASMARSLDLDDLEGAREYRPWQAYGQAKLANVLFTYALARRLAGTGVTVNCLHPGLVATNVAREAAPLWLPRPITEIVLYLLLLARVLLTPKQGAQTSLHLATSPAVESLTGRYFARSKEKRSIPVSYDVSLQERIWAVSEQLTGLAQEGRHEASNFRCHGRHRPSTC